MASAALLTYHRTAFFREAVMSSSNQVSDPESILTVVDPRPEEEVLAQYATDSLQAEPFAEKPTVEDPEEPKKKKKGGGLKKILIGCVGLGCLGVIVVLLLGGGGAAVAVYLGSSGGGGFAMPEGWELPEDWSMPDMGGGETGDEAGVADAGTGEDGAEEGSGEEGGEDGAAGDEAGEDGAGEEGAGEEGAGEEGAGEEDAGEEDAGEEDAVAEETPTPAEVVEVQRPEPVETVITVNHQAATMTFVGDSIALSATTPGYSRCKVLVVYRGADGGAWKTQSMSRSGESHSTSLTVTGEMAPEFQYYLTVKNCGTGRAPSGGGSYTVGVF